MLFTTFYTLWFDFVALEKLNAKTYINCLKYVKLDQFSWRLIFARIIFAWIFFCVVNFALFNLDLFLQMVKFRLFSINLFLRLPNIQKRCKKCVLRNFAKLTGKYLRQSLLFSCRPQASDLQLYLKGDSGTGVFL